MKDGGSAFPIYPRSEGFRSTEISNALGMTLRDYFAAKAMPMAWERKERDPAPEFFKNVAACAYMMADEMLKARQE